MSFASVTKAAGIVQDADGRIVGRTRLQKIAYLLCAAGLEDGFRFSYRHFGPYSEELASAIRNADLLGLVSETEQQTSWGGAYSVYTTKLKSNQSGSKERHRLAAEAASADAVELELAATAVFLAKEGYRDPWAETARRKPDKVADGRLERARALYSKLAAIETPKRLPRI
jgi:uncharacterized protein YwgA